MLKLLYLSDRMIGSSSAYSTVAYETCTRLASLGHRVAHIPMNRANRMGRQVNQNVLIYESGETPFGEDVAVKDYIDFHADMLITNKEPWIFSEIHRWAINFVPHAIIDHSPVSPNIMARLDNAFKIIAISRHGEQELRKKGKDSTYIPNGVRTDLYTPLEKKPCKKMFFLPEDDFTVGVVAMNRSRKMIPRMLQGYRRFLDLNPDVKSHLMLWTNVFASRPPDSTIMGVSDVGVNLLPEIYELNLGNNVNWPKWDEIEMIGGIPVKSVSGWWDMQHLYNSFDVLLGTTGGEGAGLPYLEAASVGVPSIGTQYAAAPEYVGPAGLLARVDDYVILNTPGTRYALASLDDIAEGLTRIMNSDHEKLARRARLHAEKYSWERIIENYWKPFLEKCEIELYPKLTASGVSRWD